MEAVLEAVQDGTFAREWISENQTGRPSYTQRRQAEKNHDIEDVGERLRSLFSWAEAEQTENQSEDEPAVTVNE